MFVVLCNCPPAVAGPLSRALVGEGLAACVNAIPGVVSTYLWEGRLHEDAETTLLIKVKAEGVEALAARIRELHPYTVPEIVVLAVDSARTDPRYLAWVRAASPIQESP